MGDSHFEYRFGRLPEGMWLPETGSTRKLRWMCWRETGSNSQSLRLRQAKRIRNDGSRSWQDVSGDRLTPPWLI